MADHYWSDLDSDWSAVMQGPDGLGIGMIFVFFIVLIAAAIFGFGYDENGFACPQDAQTVWEDDHSEIEGCILPDGKWMDDPS